ncbi:Sorting nexin-22, putative [Perkinsus marinus ATCC 50983]|uniref:Sorting nexin-22, putative n=1 Tax=Perkinsus marinus (strain ATCC 50983 / TXsc) TaxID=423536 RepID=C5KDM0_PERM5|nr:Sorting nexin-22, putative [Perkinsus marinus ATCC 50983]EER17323.1 Sorting nexin-22, putative [Perkinsus marinus ATCC 50983]|eukprot:XP_002785527.1 Sorting nexin-22, putative [Perkinsus marinus ATCC 50983]
MYVPGVSTSYQLPRFKAKFIGNNSQDGYTEYFIEVSNLANGDKWTVSRRYREIRELHDHLKLKYPDRIPKIPSKKLWGTMDPQFIEERQKGLQAYMDGVLAIEPDVRTRVLQKFLEVDVEAMNLYSYMP